MNKLVWIGFFLFLFQGVGWADTVVLKDGRVLYGEIVEDKRGSRTIQMNVYSEQTTILRSAIASIEKEGEGEISLSSKKRREQRERSTQRRINPAATVPQITPQEAEKRYQEHFPQETLPRE